MKRIVAVVLSMALAGSVIPAQAQQGTTAPTTKSVRKRATPKASGPTISTQLSEMKKAIDAQQQQIKQLSDLVQSRDQKIQQLEQRLDQGQTVARHYVDQFWLRSDRNLSWQTLATDNDFRNSAVCLDFARQRVVLQRFKRTIVLLDRPLDHPPTNFRLTAKTRSAPE